MVWVVARDYVQAYKWFGLAAALGNDQAEKNLDIVSQKLTSAQISQAQAEAIQWAQKSPPALAKKLVAYLPPFYDARKSREKTVTKITWNTDLDEQLKAFSWLLGTPIVIAFSGGINLDAVLYSDDIAALGTKGTKATKATFVLIDSTKASGSARTRSLNLEKELHIKSYPEVVIVKVVTDRTGVSLLSEVGRISGGHSAHDYATKIAEWIQVATSAPQRRADSGSSPAAKKISQPVVATGPELYQAILKDLSTLPETSKDASAPRGSAVTLFPSEKAAGKIGKIAVPLKGKWEEQVVGYHVFTDYSAAKRAFESFSITSIPELGVKSVGHMNAHEQLKEPPPYKAPCEYFYAPKKPALSLRCAALHPDLPVIVTGLVSQKDTGGNWKQGIVQKGDDVDAGFVVYDAIGLINSGMGRLRMIGTSSAPSSSAADELSNFYQLPLQSAPPAPASNNLVSRPPSPGIDAISTKARAGDQAAFAELTRLATAGQAAAQYYLGRMYADGKGVSRDYREARRWYDKAIATLPSGTQRDRAVKAREQLPK